MLVVKTPPLPPPPEAPQGADMVVPLPLFANKYFPLFNVGDLVEILEVPTSPTGGRLLPRKMASSKSKPRRGEVIEIYLNTLGTQEASLRIVAKNGKFVPLPAGYQTGIPLCSLNLIQSATERYSQEYFPPPVCASPCAHVLIRQPTVTFTIAPPADGVLCFFWDLESTGLQTDHDEITQIGCAPRLFYQGKWSEVPAECEAEFSCFVKADKSIPPPISKLTGITDEILKEKGISLNKALSDWREWIDTMRSAYPDFAVWFVAHNGNRFDIPLLFHLERHKLERPPGDFFRQIKLTGIVDTLVLSRCLPWYKKASRSHKLEVLYSEMFNEKMPHVHNALGDVRGLAALMTKDPFLSAWQGGGPMGWSFTDIVSRLGLA
eukprot:Platyproteum_vivax@DN15056_c0_g1_i1.p1